MDHNIQCLSAKSENALSKDRTTFASTNVKDQFVSSQTTILFNVFQSSRKGSNAMSDSITALAAIQGKILRTRQLAAETANSRKKKALLAIADAIEQRARQLDEELEDRRPIVSDADEARG
ncbi:hypothetical protein [Bradyrhizobium sp. 5.13L]